MNTREWIETVLPRVTERLHKELLLLDPVPEEYAATPTAAAGYHLSRHTQRMTVTRGKGSKGKVTGKLPSPCMQPLPGCKAFGLARALLACQPGAPGIAAAIVTRYVDVALASIPALDKILKSLSPATKALADLLGPKADGLQPRGQKLLREAVRSHDALVRSWDVMVAWAALGFDEFSTAYTPNSPGKKHHLHHIDRITEPLLGCYTDREVADLVSDGEEGGDAEARVANRRKKLTGTRQGGRSGKPGRPRKVRTET
ncbi:MAG: hypothetical protein WBP56_13420 [Polyangia bacterium]